MNYNIKIIPNASQRYETVGDYWEKHQQLIEIRVSDFTEVCASSEAGTVFVNSEAVKKAESFEFLVAIHELVEAFLARRDGIDFKKIDEFDLKHVLSEQAESEPGEQEDCPYKEQHIKATLVEQYLAQIIAVNWEEYSEAVQHFHAEGDSEQEIKYERS